MGYRAAIQLVLKIVLQLFKLWDESHHKVPGGKAVNDGIQKAREALGKGDGASFSGSVADLHDRVRMVRERKNSGGGRVGDDNDPKGDA